MRQESSGNHDPKRIDGRYEIIETIGHGGSATVYLAYDLGLERQVALKEFHLLKGAASRARIEQESVIFAKLSHPNIVRLYDVVFANDTIYLVLEHIDGSDLGQRIKQQPLTFPVFKQYCLDIASAIEYLHQKGVIHRDIKPSNILISPDDHAFISDLGIGKKVDGDSDQSVTMTGQLIGTPVYMSPEAMNGDAAFASDIYSLGAVMYEMLTGETPFIGSTVVDLVIKAQSTPAPDVRDRRPQVPETIASLISAMLNKSAADRPSLEAIMATLKSLDLSAIREEVPFVTHMLNAESLSQPVPPPAAAPKTQAASFFPDFSITQQAAPEAADANEFSPIFQTVIIDKEAAKPKGFFSDDKARHEEFRESIKFYRSHLDKDYQTLLRQARVSFFFWLVCSSLAFVLLGIGVGLLYTNAIAAGAITIASNAFILFIQGTFKNREEYYRDQASKKSKHLEAGNIWNLAAQSADGIGDAEKRRELLEKITAALVTRLQDDHD